MEEHDPSRLSDEQIAAIREALFRGNKILAIKLYREASGFGLAESKEFIDALEVRLRQEEPEQFGRVPDRAGCAGVLAVTGLTTALVRWLW